MTLFRPIHHNLRYTFDLIRGVAVLLVLFSHLDNYKMFVIWPLSFTPIGSAIGQLGVDLFFLLSGYLIWASARQILSKPMGICQYAIHRFTRIYPLYILCILSIVACANMFIGNKQPVVNVEIILRHLFFLQDFSPNVSRTLNSPFWSLTHEFLFYLSVPLIYLLKPTRVFFIVSIFVTQLMVACLVNIHPFVNYWCLFAIGILVQQEKKLLNSVLNSILLWVMTVAVFFHYPIVKSTFFVFVYSLLIFNLLMQASFKHWIFKPLIGLGIVSYSVYVWHYVLIHLISPYVKNVHLMIAPVEPWFPFGVAMEALFLIVFILLFSTMSYLLIEKPSMTILRANLMTRCTLLTEGK